MTTKGRRKVYQILLFFNLYTNAIFSFHLKETKYDSADVMDVQNVIV